MLSFTSSSMPSDAESSLLLDTVVLHRVNPSFLVPSTSLWSASFRISTLIHSLHMTKTLHSHKKISLNLKQPSCARSDYMCVWTSLCTVIVVYNVAQNRRVVIMFTLIVQTVITGQCCLSLSSSDVSTSEQFLSLEDNCVDA